MATNGSDIHSSSPTPPPSPDTRVVNYPPNSNPILFTNFSVLYESPDRPDQVCKVPCPWPEFECAHDVERRIYQRLEEHPNLVKVIEMDQYGIWLERAQYGCLRQYYMEGGEATLQERLQWCEDVASVLDYGHGKNVRHADLSGRNLLVNADKKILLCDFSGSSIDDQAATIMAEDGYRHPDRDEYTAPTIRCEIHTLGSTIYEIITGKEPHHGLEKEAIGKLLEQGQYLNASKVPLGDIVRRCWEGDFNSAAEVVGEIAECKLIRSPHGPSGSTRSFAGGWTNRQGHNSKVAPPYGVLRSE
ncbi:Mitogen-activated protein kinase kinase kinase MLT [Tolypocladium ophioglossoides CBS 100239]|uniref:EKC/KEOPS complex subunit BUD32 n=1 Tax=Tolypocladium ophioglossoides (strain CBS 100239) TaxID=1163406 RepID=A0A0L0MXN3_TOLOC|nr:Mitogen-activated protein kinase kinase kinase MLT [Tolypocladium ophioglossoides CBS 100239]